MKTAWIKHKPSGNVAGTYSKRETLPRYTWDTPVGTYHVAPYRDSKGVFVCWDVKLNTYAPDAKGLHWVKVDIGLKVHDAQGAAKQHAREAYPACVVCGLPFAHGCNTAACSTACEQAAWNSPDRAKYYPDAV